jgi:hypothetical protein
MTERTARARRASACLVLAVVAVVSAAGPADAAVGDLHVHAGRLPDGTATTVGPWTGLTTNAPGGTGTFGIGYDAVGQGYTATARLVSTPSLPIVSATIDRSYATPVSAHHSQPQITSSWENRGWPYGGHSSSGGFVGEAGNGVVTATTPGELAMTLSCVAFDGVPGQCESSFYRIARLDLALHDSDPPTVTGSMTGTLVTDSGWQTGSTGSVRVTAADTGAGVYRAFIREGSMTWYALADADGVRCRDAIPGNATAYDFVPSATSLVPCPTTATQFDPSFDLTTLGDGTHTVSFGIEDAGGNERTVLANRSLRINAPGGSLPDPGMPCTGGVHDAAGVCQPTAGAGGGGGTGGAGGVTPVEPIRGGSATPTTTPPAPVGVVAPPFVDGPAGNGERATAAAQLAIRVGGTPRTKLTVAYGRSVTVTGSLLTRSGQPIAGATIDVTIARAGTSARGPELVTDRAGAFSLMLPAGASRTVRFGYRAFAGDAQDADSASLELSVRTRARLTATPRRLRNGSAVTFRGRVSGAPARSRKLLELQVRQGARWLTFATLRLTSGRFTYRYRFTRTRQTTRYVFRAIVPGDAGWPYASGASNHVAVSVHP